MNVERRTSTLPTFVWFTICPQNQQRIGIFTLDFRKDFLHKLGVKSHMRYVVRLSCWESLMRYSWIVCVLQV